MFKIYKSEPSYTFGDFQHNSWLLQKAEGAVLFGFWLLYVTQVLSMILGQCFLEYPKFTIGLIVFFGICSIGGVFELKEEQNESE